MTAIQPVLALAMRVVFLFGLTISVTLRAQQLTPAQSDFFENKIRPILANNCYKCHSQQAVKIKGGLLLDTRDGWMKGGDTGPAIVPGDPDTSLLIKAVRYTDSELQMPPRNQKLPDTAIDDLIVWVKMGAPDPRLTTAIGTNLN